MGRPPAHSPFNLRMSNNTGTHPRFRELLHFFCSARDAGTVLWRRVWVIRTPSATRRWEKTPAAFFIFAGAAGFRNQGRCIARPMTRAAGRSKTPSCSFRPRIALALCALTINTPAELIVKAGQLLSKLPKAEAGRPKKSAPRVRRIYHQRPPRLNRAETRCRDPFTPRPRPRFLIYLFTPVVEVLSGFCVAPDFGITVSFMFVGGMLG